MKRLKIFALDGTLVTDTLVNVEGENFAMQMNIPLILPIIAVSLEDEKKENKSWATLLGYDKETES